MITVNPLPTAIFTFPANSLCITNPISPIQFTYSGTGAVSWSWDFGDRLSASGQNTSSLQNPTHSYISPGSYLITLIVTNSYGCAAVSTQIVNIVSDCCALAIAYDDNLIPSTTITSNTIWGMSYNNYKLNKTYTVKAPYVLTVDNNVTIKFGPLGKIIVENAGSTSAGAQLVLNPGAKLTSVTSCPVMWQGVEVWGNASKGSSNNAGYGQGKITMNAGTTIENAHIGVLLGKFICSPDWDICSPLVVSNGGGIIMANGANFNNNAVSVRFLPYTKSNTSIIQSCTFSAPALLDPGYNSNISGYHYFNDANPYYALANGLGMGVWHISLWGVKYVQFYDNTFNGIYGESILAIDSRFYAQKISTGNIFNVSPNNLWGLIHIINTVSSPEYYHIIQDNIFNVNFFNNYPGINIEGSQSADLISGNFFNPSVIPIPSGANAQADGIRLSNSSGFKIYGNNFNILFRGIQVYNSGVGGGNIGFPGGNSFTQCHTSILAFTSNASNIGNPKLQIKCNNFDNHLPQYYNDAPLTDANISSAGALADQGVNTSTTDPDPNKDKKPAGNEFLQVRNPPDPPNDKNQISADHHYVYYRHNRDANKQLKILPNQTNSPKFITIANTGVDKKISSCDPYPCLCQPNCCHLMQLSTQAVQLQTLKQSYNTVFATLDKGQTAQLLAAIGQAGNVLLRLAAPGNNAKTKHGIHDDDDHDGKNNQCKDLPDPGELKELLIRNSPLSDEVLISFITRKCETPPGIFKEVMMPNLPVSDTVLINALLPKIKTLPTGIANQIMDLQGNNSVYRTLTSIVRDINSTETQRAQALSEVIEYYVQADSLDKLTALLENEGTDYANQLLAGLYLADSNLTAASGKLNLLPNSTPADQAYINLNRMLITLGSEGKTVFAIDSAQEQLVRQIAAMPASCLARTNARAILLLVFNERFLEEIPSSPQLRMAQNQEEIPTEITTETENSIYPNPANENAELHYQLSAGESGTLDIFSIVGNKVASYPIPSTQEQFIIPVKSFQNGLYLYRFSVNGELMEEGKLVVINK
ncbi:MAG: PKD domain-containing protein [Bacteroidetes bacterium]|nr:PKD domain-containing protein [Bacteroidota bacterium]